MPKGVGNEDVLTNVISDYIKNDNEFTVKLELVNKDEKDADPEFEELTKMFHTQKQNLQPTEPTKVEKKQYESQSKYFANFYTGETPQLEEYLDVLYKDKAQDLVVFDLKKKCSWANYMIVVTGASRTHMLAMARHIVNMLKSRKINGLKPSIEGKDSELWMIVDGGTICVQIFSAEGRAYYDIERKWAFTKIEEYEPLMHVDPATMIGKTLETNYGNIKFELMDGDEEDADPFSDED
ncbi:ribosomal silencing factor RsfS [Acrasis kona]|uniref:Ribosomal silencing factor RsfS n=1 Tax=Acrasis kona TaxID=1008807 RepID=A0AAW2ZHA9_9EUKA